MLRRPLIFLLAAQISLLSWTALAGNTAAVQGPTSSAAIGKTAVEAKALTWIGKIKSATNAPSPNERLRTDSPGFLDRLKKSLGGKTSSSYEDIHGVRPHPDFPCYSDTDCNAGSKDSNILFAPRFVNDELRSVHQINPSLNLTPKEFFNRFSKDLGLSLGPEGSEMAALHSEKEETGLIDPLLKTPIAVEWIHYVQKYRGLEVLGTGYTLRLQNGLVSDAMGKVVGDLSPIETAPSFSKDEALASAEKLASTTPDGSGADIPPSAELAVSTKNYSMKAEDAALVWRVISGKEAFEINAKTGELWNRLPLTASDTFMEGENVPSSGLGYYGYGTGPDPKKLDFIAKRQNNGDFELGTYQQGSGQAPFGIAITVQDCRKVKEGTAADSFQPECKPFSSVGQKNDFSDPPSREGVSILWAAENFLTYLFKNFKTLEGKPWLGIDGYGKASLDLRLVDQLGGFGVFWGKGASFGVNACPDGTCLPNVDFDIVGHELSHGIVERTVGLIRTAESGSIDEAVSDIFALVARHSLSSGKESAPENPWIFSADQNDDWAFSLYAHPPQGIRGLNNPILYGMPDEYKGMNYLPMVTPCDDKNDQCGAHHNSSIVGQWFYILSKRLGVETARDILFEVFRSRLLYPAAQFMDLRNATEFAAALKFPGDSQKVRDVDEAWHLVGLGESPRTYWPGRGTDGMPWPVTLGWTRTDEEKETGACYEVEWDEHFSFRKNPQKKIICESVDPSLDHFMAPVFDAKPNTFYYWRIRPVPSDQVSAVGDQGEAAKGAEGPSLWNLLDAWKKGPSSPASFKAPSPADLQKIQVAKEPVWGDTQMLKTAEMRPFSLSPPMANTPTIPAWRPVHFAWNPPPENTDWKEYALVALGFERTDGIPCADEDPEAKQSLFVPVTGFSTDSPPLGKGLTYSWHIASVGPNGTMSPPSGFTVLNGCGIFRTSIPKAELLSPGPGLSGQTVDVDVTAPQVTLKWKKVDGAGSYRVKVAKDPEFTQMILPTDEPDNLGEDNVSKTIVLPKNNAGPFYWYVIPIGPKEVDFEWGDRSDIGSFTLAPLQAPQDLKWSQALCGKSMTLGWNSVKGAVGYHVRVCGKSLGCYDTDTSGISVSIPAQNGTADWAGYTWAVWGKYEDGSPGQVSTGTYAVNLPPLTLIHPQDSSTNNEYWGQSFSWDFGGCPAGSYSLLINGHELVASYDGSVKSSWQDVATYFPLPGESTSYARPLRPSGDYLWCLTPYGPDGSDRNLKTCASFITKSGPDPFKNNTSSTPMSGSGSVPSCPAFSPINLQIQDESAIGGIVDHVNDPNAGSIPMVPNSVSLTWKGVPEASKYLLTVYQGATTNFAAVVDALKNGQTAPAGGITCPLGAGSTTTYVGACMPMISGTRYLAFVQAQDACGKTSPAVLAVLFQVQGGQ